MSCVTHNVYVHVRLHSHLDSMTSMMLVGTKTHCEIILKHVLEVAGRIKTLWGRSRTVFGQSIFEKNPTPVQLDTSPTRPENVVLTPPRQMSIKEKMSYINEDEVLEVTPKHLRLRKKYLDPHERKRMSKSNSQNA